MSFDDIIVKVRAHPELWQTSHPFYRHRDVSARTWMQIAEELKIDDWYMIKKRWKHLKDQFRKEVRKVTSNQIALSSWVHYKQLQFLTDEVTKKPDRKQESEESAGGSESDDKPLKTKKQKARKRHNMLSSIDTKKQSSIKFKRIMRTLNTISRTLERSSSSKHMDDNFKDDTDYMFLVSLLPTMKVLSDIQRLHFRGKINNWLLNALSENEMSEECDTKAYVQAQINLQTHTDST